MKRINWQTAGAGYLAIALLILTEANKWFDGRADTMPDWQTVLPEVLIAFGVTRARQSNRTSEDLGLKQQEPEPPRQGGGVGATIVTYDRTALAPAPAAPPAKANPPTLTLWLLIGLLAAASPIVFTAGCTTDRGSGDGGWTNTNTPARIRLGAEYAARAGARIDLARNPTHRAEYLLANEALARLLQAQDYDPDKFAAVLKQLPVDSQRADEVLIATETLGLLWSLTLLETPVADRTPMVKAFLEGAHAGLTQALATQPRPAP